MKKFFDLAEEILSKLAALLIVLLIASILLAVLAGGIYIMTAPDAIEQPWVKVFYIILSTFMAWMGSTWSIRNIMSERCSPSDILYAVTDMLYAVMLAWVAIGMAQYIGGVIWTIAVIAVLIVSAVLELRRILKRRKENE